MKTNSISFALALLCITSTQAAPPIPGHIQPSSYSSHTILAGVFGAFHAHRQQDDAALQWNVTVNDVTEFVIERSYDGSFFEIIASVPPQEGAWNKYRDNAVFPGHIFYRIKAVLADGTSEYSDVEEVRIAKRG